MTAPTRPGNGGTNVTVALSGLLTGMFVSAISSTVVVTSLPVIVPQLHGGQATYTWIATASLLAMTVSTPIWGKLADLFDRKKLFGYGIGLLIVASLVAGLAADPNVLIAMRVVQGIGAGGLAALTQIILADIVSPRERGRYAGMIGAVLTSANIGGPLVGGLITDSLGWRWNFFFVVPVAVVALLLVNGALRLPPRPGRAASVDYLGATLISAGVGLFLIWLTVGGTEFGRTSALGWLLLSGSVVSTVAAVRVEARAEEPLIPLSLFRNPTVSLSIVGSLATGATMFSALVFLPQYFQFARGASAVVSGLMTIPITVGLLLSTTFVGRLITRYGRWKPYLVGGGVCLVAGASWLSQLSIGTSYTTVAVGMFLMGTGVGALLQNLVIITQNAVDRANIGAATAAVTFFRSLGGAVGISILGAALQAGVAGRIHQVSATLPATQQATVTAQIAKGGVVDPRHLPPPLDTVVASAYGSGIGSLFLLLAVFALVALAAVIAIPPATLSRAPAGGTPAGRPAPEQSRGDRVWSADVFRFTGETVMLPEYSDGPRAQADGRQPVRDDPPTRVWVDNADPVPDHRAPSWALDTMTLPVYARPSLPRAGDRTPPWARQTMLLPTYNKVARRQPDTRDTIQLPDTPSVQVRREPARPSWTRDTSEWPIVRTPSVTVS